MISFINIFKKRITYLVIFIIGFVTYYALNYSFKNKSNINTALITTTEPQKEKAITVINRDISILKTTSTPHPNIITETIVQQIPSELISDSETIQKKESERKMPIILNIYNKMMNEDPEISSDQESEPVKEPVPSKFAPYGRLLKCELVNTVDSSNLETPIIGLIMEPLYWNGDLIIPAGSEVHGIAKTNKLRERITSGDSWNIILPADDDRPNGAVLKVTGVALDQENPNGDSENFGITDGSFGLRGFRIKSNNFEEIKLFASTFLSALTAGLQNQVPAGGLLGGTKTNNSFRDATLGGTSAVMARFAEHIEKEIAENGFYTRVPAGKQFYLYVQQTINPNHWNMAQKSEKSKENQDLLEKDPFIVEQLDIIKSYIHNKTS